MRGAWLLVGLSACGDNATQPDAPTGPMCGTSAPALPTCVAHGLAQIDLNGTWTFTGMQTEISQPIGTMPPPPTTTTTMVTFDVSFTIHDCSILSVPPGSVDDTNVTDPGLFTSRESQGSNTTICATADGAILFHSLRSFFRQPPVDTEGTIEDTGTLTR
jgi:putative hemolysin